MPTASLTRLRKLPLLSNRTLSSLLRRLDGDHEIDAAARAALRVLHGRPDDERGPPPSAAITTVRSGPRSGRKPQPERHPRPGVAEPDVPATSSGHRGRAGRGPTRHPTEATTTTDGADSRPADVLQPAPHARHVSGGLQIPTPPAQARSASARGLLGVVPGRTLDSRYGCCVRFVGGHPGRQGSRGGAGAERRP